MTEKSFFQRKSDWLVAVAEDVRLHKAALATSIAMKLFAQYFHNTKEIAWPSIERLADELGADRRSVQRAIAQLIECGHLVCEPGGRGPGHTNTYRLPNGPTAAKDDHNAALKREKGRRSSPKRAAFQSQKGGQNAARVVLE
jgi:DNA-binding transcriptional MocR family regulator